MTGPNGRAKRAVDLLVGALAMVMSAPLLGVLAIAIKWSSPGPVLFRQERVGRGRRPFTMLKLRTMVDGADRMVAELLARDGTDERFYKFQDDPRITRVGAFLRRWSLDELPQLWNVLRGEMSLVGPRPALASEVRAYAPWQLRRLEVRPGMTGAWQVSGRSELGFDDCVRLDLAYIDGWRLARDVGILIRTAPAVLRRRGAL
ncbi:sugar transferase [Actinoallomurus rhizosphaericola]|uniref:sugar transferase n=1 Tax=Actinoallomurus rhizosphaericola TaxID=2952536 RepID=UPI0020902723|nr:sugar transferase [Actinoallomurus rhizosphaericola]MCO5993884.1 sugar transferase [Actinoallomurus rhizosphaericola]